MHKSSTGPFVALCLALCVGCASGPTVDPTAVPAAPENQEATSPDSPPIIPVAKGSKTEDYDEVLAIVGSEVVTRGSIRDALASALEAATRDWQKSHPGKPLPDEEVRKVEFGLVRDRISDILLADHVDMLGHDPKNVQRLVDRMLEDELRRARNEAGSDQELRERLHRRGMSVEEYRSIMQDRIKRQIAVSEELRGIRNSQLLATPRRMLEFYEKNKQLFSTKAEVDVTTLRFEPSEGAKPPLERAKDAAARLRAGEDPVKVAAALGGSIKALDGLQPGAGISEFITDFAFAAGRKAGDVSEPIQTGERAQLLKATRVVAESTRPFRSREVQREIQDQIFRQRRREILMRIDSQEQRRIRVQFGERFRK